MAFKVMCDFCNGNGKFEFERGCVFITCEDCGQEREVIYPQNVQALSDEYSKRKIQMIEVRWNLRRYVLDADVEWLIQTVKKFRPI